MLNNTQQIVNNYGLPTLTTASSNRGRFSLNKAETTIGLFTFVLMQQVPTEITSLPYNQYEKKPSLTDSYFSLKYDYESEAGEEAVQSYIQDKAGVLDFLKALPSLIQSVFIRSQVTMSLSVFIDCEEDWSNLCVEIFSDYEIEELTLLENELFGKIDARPDFLSAVNNYVTLSLR